MVKGKQRLHFVEKVEIKIIDFAFHILLPFSILSIKRLSSSFTFITVIFIIQSDFLIDFSLSCDSFDSQKQNEKIPKN